MSTAVSQRPASKKAKTSSKTNGSANGAGGAKPAPAHSDVAREPTPANAPASVPAAARPPMGMPPMAGFMAGGFHPMQRLVFARPPGLMAPQFSFLEQTTASGFGKKPDEWSQASGPPEKVHRAQSDTSALRKRKHGDLNITGVREKKKDIKITGIVRDRPTGLDALVNASRNMDGERRDGSPAKPGSAVGGPSVLKKAPSKAGRSASQTKPKKAAAGSDDEEPSDELKKLLPIPVPDIEEDLEADDDEDEVVGETEEAKKLRRLQKNRHSAQLSRQRKQLYLQTLEKNVRYLLKAESNGKAEVRQLEGQLDWLRTKVTNLLKKKNTDDISDFKERLQRIMHERPPLF